MKVSYDRRKSNRGIIYSRKRPNGLRLPTGNYRIDWRIYDRLHRELRGRYVHHQGAQEIYAE